MSMHDPLKIVLNDSKTGGKIINYLKSFFYAIKKN